MSDNTQELRTFTCTDGFDHRIGQEAVDSGHGARPMGAQICLNCRVPLSELIKSQTNQAVLEVLDRVEEELQLSDGYGEVHVSHVCPQDNVGCAKFAQRGQTRHWQRQKLATLRKELTQETKK